MKFKLVVLGLLAACALVVAAPSRSQSAVSAFHLGKVKRSPYTCAHKSASVLRFAGQGDGVPISPPDRPDTVPPSTPPNACSWEMIALCITVPFLCPCMK